MSKITVCTGFSPAGYVEYGKRFLARFHAFWPRDVSLRFYTEEPADAPRGVCVSLWDCTGAKAFADRHRDNAAAHGLKEVPGWKPKDRDRGYSYRFDAGKFFKQLMIPEHCAARFDDGTILAWLDADVMTLSHVPIGFIEGLIGDADLVYLGRERFHSDIGFWAVRLNSLTRAFLGELADIWRSDRVFELPEWHSAFVFDHCRRNFEAVGGNAINLTPGGRGHVWFQSPLRAYTDHLKGGRKAIGRSLERNQR